jgi:transcriptional regulator with XRE-family HTH domain
MREVKLPAMIKQLIDEGSRGNRKRVCAELGITPAALSQYINGQTTPGLDKLLAMAELFSVPLDYLVFGPDPIGGYSDTVEYGPVTRYVEAGISSVQADIAAQSAFVAKVGEILASQIDAAAKAAAKRPSTLHGMLDKEQALELERFVLEATIVTMDLTDDIVQIDSDVEQGVTAGNFLAVTARNLAQGRPYHFVLSPEIEEQAAQYRSLLLAQNLDEADLQYCRFDIALDTFHVGCCLFRVDVRNLRRRSPVLHRYLAPFLTEDNRIGYIEPPSSPLHAYFLLEPERMNTARKVLQRLTPPAPSSDS